MLRRRSFWISLILLFAIAGGSSYYFYDDYLAQYFEPEPVVVDQAPSTAQVRRGDIVITANGVGTLFPASEINLGFSSSGIIWELNVQVGDRVAKGDSLAAIDDTDLRLAVVQAGINLRLAELDVATLTKDASIADIAAAESTLASAQSEYEVLMAPPTDLELAVAQNQLLSAQQTLNTLLSGMSPDEERALSADLRSAEIVVQQAQWDYDAVKWRGDAGSSAQSAALQDATITYEKALANYNISAQGAKAEEITAARANLAQAQDTLNALKEGADSMAIVAAEAKVTQAQAALDDLKLGPDVDLLEAEKLALQQAKHNMDAAMLDLENTIIRSPIDGVVTAVNAALGSQAGSENIISLADASTAEVQFWVEEIDIASAIPGNPVTIIFEAFPEFTYNGQIERVEPTLVDVEGASAVQAWASIDLGEHPVQPLFGMGAEVEVTAGEARNALLVPVQALRELVPGSLAVFVVLSDGELELRPVEVGLRDFVNAEILSGVSEGEEISTGDIDTQ